MYMYVVTSLNIISEELAWINKIHAVASASRQYYTSRQFHTSTGWQYYTSRQFHTSTGWQFHTSRQYYIRRQFTPTGSITLEGSFTPAGSITLEGSSHQQAVLY